MVLDGVAGPVTAAGRACWLAVGLLALGAGIAGIVLPLVPTTGFLLLAAFAFARSSPRLHGWLLAHPRLGPPIHDWQAHRCIRPRAKALAVAAMAASVLGAWLAGLGAAPLAAQAAILALVAGFLLSRPSRPRGAGGSDRAAQGSAGARRQNEAMPTSGNRSCAGQETAGSAATSG